MFDLDRTHLDELDLLEEQDCEIDVQAIDKFLADEQIKPVNLLRYLDAVSDYNI